MEQSRKDILKKYFEGKKITVMGLGLLGRGVGDTEFLARQGAVVTVTDLKDEDQLRSSLRKITKFANIKYTLGEHNLRDFKKKDMILKSAGVPLNSPFIKEARKEKIPVEMSSSLFAKITREITPNVTIIGITGTRGKSTVTHLIAEILKTAGKKFFLGGNVRGVATLPFVQEIKDGDFAVLELDSWQLQGFGDSQISPNISVFTNFYDDHLNYYKNNRELYFKDKANIFSNQTENDFLITTQKTQRTIYKNFDKKKIKSKVLTVTSKDTPSNWKIKIPGEHNLENIALAIKACQAVGIDEKIIRTAVENFKGVAGRLEYMKTVDGVEIYNDNNATSPEATMVALNAFGSKEKNIVLIMGGSDKGLAMDNLIKEIKKHCKGVVLLDEKGTQKIEKEILSIKNLQTHKEDTLKKCVLKAMEIAKKGDIVLFSPAFASFGKFFKNEFDRNDQFVDIVEKL